MGMTQGAREVAGKVLARGQFLQDNGAAPRGTALSFGPEATESAKAEMARLNSQRELVSFAAPYSENDASAVAAVEGLGGKLGVYLDDNADVRAVLDIPDGWRDVNGGFKPGFLKDALLHMHSAWKRNGRDWTEQQDRLTFRDGGSTLAFSDVVQMAGMQDFFQRGVDATGARDRDRVFASAFGVPGLWNSPAYSEAYQGDILQSFEVKNPDPIPVYRLGKGGELIQTAADARVLYHRIRADRYAGIYEKGGNDDPNADRFEQIAKVTDEVIHPVLVGGIAKEFERVGEAHTKHGAFDRKELAAINEEVAGLLEGGARMSPIPGRDGWHFAVVPSETEPGEWNVYSDDDGNRIILNVKGIAPARGRYGSREQEEFGPSFWGAQP